MNEKELQEVKALFEKLPEDAQREIIAAVRSRLSAKEQQERLRRRRAE